MSKVVICIVGLFFACSTWAAGDSIGIFMTVKGEVHVGRGGEKLVAKSGLAVMEGDVVITASDSRAKIAMKDRNIISVSPDTIFKIQAYKNDGAQKTVDLRLKSGKLRNEVNSPYDGEKSKFEIKTSSAVIGVRGTDFISSFDPHTKVTDVVTLHGKVWLRGLIGGAPAVITVGQSASVARNQAPSVPEAVKPEQLNEIRKDFESNVKGTDKGADGGAVAPKDGDSSTTGDSRDKGTTEASSKERLNDKSDQSSDTFKDTTDAGGSKTALTAPALRPPKPVTSSPSSDIIQNNQQQKQKVIIKPTR